ncbi:hypothetical protein QJQ45_003458 [Haematococcus lacustris]|nr:hypothetical protein QJQ45_003458 [Haematococcus lacustris]
MTRKKRRTGVGGPRAVPEDPDFDIVDRDEAGQPDLTEAQRKRKASGEARAARIRDNTFHARKAKLAHLIDHLPQALWDAFLDKAVRPRVKTISERGVIGSLLLGFLVASRWDALLPDPRRQKLASPKHRFDQVVHTDGVAISVMFLRPKPAAPPAELPRMSKGMGAVDPLAHLHAEWLGVDPGKTNMATVAHEERSADGLVVSVRHWTLTAGQYYRDSGITRQTQATKIWLATVKTQLTALSKVSSKPSSLASYRRFADTVLETYDAMWAEVSKKRWANARFRLYCGKKRVVASFWAKVNTQAKKLWPDRILALAYGAAGFNGSGTIGCRGVPVGQMQKEAVKQFRPERVVLVDEFRTSRVSSADNTPSETLLDTPPESFRFYDRDVSAALNIRRCAVGPGPVPLSCATGLTAQPCQSQASQARSTVEAVEEQLLRYDLDMSFCRANRQGDDSQHIGEFSGESACPSPSPSPSLSPSPCLTTGPLLPAFWQVWVKER